MSNGFYKTHAAPTPQQEARPPFTLCAFNECLGSLKPIGDRHQSIEAAAAQAVALLGNPDSTRAFFGYVVRDSNGTSVFEARGAAKPGGRYL